MAMTRNQRERAFHMAVAQFLDIVLSPPVEWTTIGHGGGGSVRGAILKAMGLKPGWPDIIISAPIEISRARACLMVGLELKSQDGTVAHHQARLHSALEKSGWQIFVCRNLHEVMLALETAGIPTRPIRLWPAGGFQLLKERANV